MEKFYFPTSFLGNVVNTPVNVPSDSLLVFQELLLLLPRPEVEGIGILQVGHWLLQVGEVLLAGNLVLKKKTMYMITSWLRAASHPLAG